MIWLLGIATAAALAGLLGFQQTETKLKQAGACCPHCGKSLEVKP